MFVGEHEPAVDEGAGPDQGPLGIVADEPYAGPQRQRIPVGPAHVHGVAAASGQNPLLDRRVRERPSDGRPVVRYSVPHGPELGVGDAHAPVRRDVPGAGEDAAQPDDTRHAELQEPSAIYPRHGPPSSGRLPPQTPPTTVKHYTTPRIVAPAVEDGRQKSYSQWLRREGLQ